MLNPKDSFIPSLIECWSIERSEIRLIGSYRGKVVDNKDPIKQGRVKVYVPELMKNVDGIWCRPLYDFKKVNIIPEIDDPVLVMFENGNIQQPVYIGHVRVNTEDDSYIGKIDDRDSSDNYIQDFWIVETPESRRLRMNDYDRYIQLGNYKTTRFIEINDKDEYIMIQSKDGVKYIKLDDKTDTISIICGSDNKIVLDNQNQTIDIISGSDTKINLNTQTKTISLQSGSASGIFDGMSQMIKLNVGSSIIQMMSSMIQIKSSLVTIN